MERMQHNCNSNGNQMVCAESKKGISHTILPPPCFKLSLYFRRIIIKADILNQN